MLRNTFCHIPGIGLHTETRLWSSGVESWDVCHTASSFPIRLTGVQKQFLSTYVEQSIENLEKRNFGYFASLLPSMHHWRLFPDIRSSAIYLDIETNGLTGPPQGTITTIALYDGQSVFHYVKGRNLAQFPEDIRKYKAIVTYNGKCFDIPFIESYFGIRLDPVHIDLRYLLKSLGYKGGLKKCEKSLGIDRGKLDGVDGFFAVVLWNDFMKTGNEKALETLLAYNIQDVINLEMLMVAAYNLKLRGTPFMQTHKIPLPSSPEILFEADEMTIRRLRYENDF